jgi:hypothetical protein
MGMWETPRTLGDILRHAEQSIIERSKMHDLLLLTFVTAAKINLIKAIRTITGMGLKDAKDGVEQGMIVSAAELGCFLINLRSQVKNDNGLVSSPFSYEVKIEPYSPPIGPVRLNVALQPTTW